MLIDLYLLQEYECRPEAEVTCFGPLHVGCGDVGGGGDSGGERAVAGALAVVIATVVLVYGIL